MDAASFNPLPIRCLLNDLEELSAQTKDIDDIFKEFNDQAWDEARTKFVKGDAFFKYAKYNLTELKEERKLLREEKIIIRRTISQRQETLSGKIYFVFLENGV